MLGMYFRNCVIALIVLAFAAVAMVNAAERPNVLWLSCEDISPDLGCYGVDYAITPNLDRFAAQGVRYTQALGVTGVCAVNRSCLITGMYPSAIGSQDMRVQTRLPKSIRCFSALLRDAGYYCTNNVKTDYNFPVPKDAWDANSRKAHWKTRKKGQPFFAVFNYTGSHESRIWKQNHAKQVVKLKPGERHDPAKAPILPFHPDTPQVRRDWANYHDNIVSLDHWFGQHLSELEAAGLADNTIVFFFSDHGAGMPGIKKWVWDGGLRVPMMVRYPKRWAHLAPDGERKPGTVTDRIISFVDYAPSVLSLCGVDIPKHMQGHAFTGKAAAPPRKHAYIIRDRMAERYDIVRGVRDKRYQYLRNFMPHLSWAQTVSYTHNMPTMRVWKQLHDEGKLNAVQDRYFQAKPMEELYDLEKDPRCVNNLADDPNHAERILKMRQLVRDWQIETRDLGLLPWYEIDRRSAGSTPYELAQDNKAYPIAKLLETAELATRRDAELIPQHLTLMQHTDPAVRWWATQALVMLAKKAAASADDVRPLLKDKSPIVRVAAAEFFAVNGQAELALKTLIDVLKHESADVRLRSINVLDRMGQAARPAADAMRRSAMKKGPMPATYLNRIAEYAPEKFESEK